ncbi:sugar transferase [Aeromicrobium sp.]|uniref:sugar transferase n=1 Tax=Aeromicrobium sp. TaxID=1871063 RepID=UPI003C59530A
MSLRVDSAATSGTGGTELDVGPTAARRTGADWQRRYGRVLVGSDLVVLLWVFTTSHVVWASNSGLAGDVAYAPAAVGISAFMALFWHVVLTVAGTRDSRVFGAGPEEYKRVLSSTLGVFAVIAFCGYVVGFNLPRIYVLVLMPFGLILLTLSRWSWRQWLLVQRQRGRMTQDAIVVGSIESVEHLVAVIGRSAAFGYRLSGACITSASPPSEVAGVPVLGDAVDLARTVLTSGTDAVIVTSSDVMHPDTVRRLGWDLEGYDVEIIVAPSLTNIAGPRVHIRPVAGLPLLHVEQPSYRGAQRWAKGLLDRAGGLALILAVSPVLVALAVAIRLTSPGKVFFVQERVGQDGRTFGMIKFRSMVEGADSMLADLQPDSGNVVMFKMRDDPRVTRVGRFLRRYSFDELPQLFNVIKGDMSLVGPRPPLVSEVSTYAAEARRRLLVRPGMTGPWQISGRSNLDWEETMRLDLYYVENWSMVGDMLILWKTFRAVISSAGAY